MAPGSARVPGSAFPGSGFGAHGSGSPFASSLFSGTLLFPLSTFTFYFHAVLHRLDRQPHTHRRPAASVELNLNLATVIVTTDGRLRGPAGAFRERAPKGWKDRIELVVGNPDSLVQTSSTTDSCDSSAPAGGARPSVSRPPLRMLACHWSRDFQTIWRSGFHPLSNETSVGATRTSMTCPSSTSELLRKSSAASFNSRRTSSRAIENRCGRAYARNIGWFR